MPKEWCCPLWVGLPTANGELKIITHKHGTRPSFSVILDSVKLTASTNHHTERIKPGRRVKHLMSTQQVERFNQILNLWCFLSVFTLIEYRTCGK